MKIFNKNEWKKVKLGDVFDLQMGKTPLRENKLYWDKGEYHWISISDMNFSEKYISSTKEKITELAVKKSGIKIIPKNTVIMSFKLSIGKVKIVNEDIYSNEAIMAFIPKTNNFIDENFLYYSLKGVRWNEGINKAVKGLTLNKALISQKEIFLPNLAIQKEIATNLDSIADFLELRKKQLNYLKELNKSLFTKYSIGEKESIANLCYVKARIGWQGLTKKEYLSNGEYYLITGVDFKNEKIDFKNCFYVTKERYNQDENIKVKINDILLTKDGTIGKVAIVDKLEKPATLNSGVFVLRPKVNNLNVTYLMHSLISEDFKKFIDDIKIGATVPHLNQAALLKYKLTLPPIELQNKFAERVEKIEKLSFEIEEAIKEAENLYNSLMSKYFD